MRPRFWQVERLVFGSWLPTDFRESGATEAEALASARRVAEVAGWEGVRLGREIVPPEHNRYCAFAWVNAN